MDTILDTTSALGAIDAFHKPDFPPSGEEHRREISYFAFSLYSLIAR